MVIALSLFCTDFLSYSIFGAWITRSLFAYFVYDISLKKSIDATVMLSFLLLLLQDSFIYGRFLLGCFYLVPAYLCLVLLGRVCAINRAFLSMIVLLIGFLMEGILVKNILSSPGEGWRSTGVKIIVNLIIVLLILIGTRGNRSAGLSRPSERKVWTPNRMDAS
jgi:hypothetical protein